MDPLVVAELVGCWVATVAITSHPQTLVNCWEWAAIGATCVPAGGDGYAYVCQSLFDEGQPEEPSS
eukprot:5110798-Lingulodinium_polyedra.AAC.1